MAATKLPLLAPLSSHARKPAPLRAFFLRCGKVSKRSLLTLPQRKKKNEPHSGEKSEEIV
jgi:hypothetical protein